jgi:formate dehydrogenase subunit delta
MQSDRLVYMANQIGSFFATQPGTGAAEAIAAHLTKFWDPRMRKAICAHLAAGGSDLDPLVRDAVALIASDKAKAG